jgi:glycosyltransferase involved in cell wall biosynthesis
MVSGLEKFDLLARADLFCLPSAAEGFSMAVLESLASSTPVLLSPGCHFPEVEKAGAGRIVETNPEAMGDALAELLAEPARLQEMGRLGRGFVAREYTWDHITDQLVDAYREGLARSRK